MRLCSTDASVDCIWHCSVCDLLLTSHLQQHLVAVDRICREALFYVWSEVPSICTAEEVKKAKANLPVPQPALIRPWLYVGDLHDAQLLSSGRLQDTKIAAVLTLCPDAKSRESSYSLFQGLDTHGVRHCEIDARDDKTYDLVAHAVPKALEFVKQFYERGDPVLVHCFGGINRAPAIAVAFMLLLERLELCISVRLVVRNRGKVLTNRRFRAQLVQLAGDEGLLGPMNDASFLCNGPAPVIPQGLGTVPPASWNTSDGTWLLELALLSLHTGRGEEQLDSKGYTLRQWEEWYKKKGSKAEDWMAVRAQAVRQSWQLLPLREVWMGFGFWMLLLERLPLCKRGKVLAAGRMNGS